MGASSRCHLPHTRRDLARIIGWGKHWHTKHAVDSNTATLSLDVDDDEERAVSLRHKKRQRHRRPRRWPSREPPRYILHEAHATELSLRGHTTSGKRCIVCVSSERRRRLHRRRRVAKKCDQRPLAARFGGVQAGLYEGEADPTKAACCVAVTRRRDRSQGCAGPGTEGTATDRDASFSYSRPARFRSENTLHSHSSGGSHDGQGVACSAHGSGVCANGPC